MNLTTATPAEIDTRLVEVLSEIAGRDASIERLAKVIDRIENAEGYERDLPWNAPEKAVEAREELAALLGERAVFSGEAAEIGFEFARRGGWTRFYLVTNRGGHVHSSTSCSTCFIDTSLVLLPAYAGATEAALVEDAGEAACTVCFPSAPVDVLRRASRIETADAKAAREAREAKKAEAAAKKAAKALFTDEPERGIRYEFGPIKTLAAARSVLADGFVWGWDRHDFYPGSLRDEVAAAVAAKEGKDAETVLAEAAKRAARRR